ncbi:hypothetical protein BKA23_2428 [Rudaeicoccus suwonensis]|uniref:Uncharacterized protein n=1 Tax=Rudaeicoccus suwonensis TaxID=657409 RepID=A0A561E3A8_9MICO|nr:hypothetical protein BKA23_2428 [Rudaeicoccus suwonensis]
MAQTRDLKRVRVRGGRAGRSRGRAGGPLRARSVSCGRFGWVDPAIGDISCGRLGSPRVSRRCPESCDRGLLRAIRVARGLLRAIRVTRGQLRAVRVAWGPFVWRAAARVAAACHSRDARTVPCHSCDVGAVCMARSGPGRRECHARARRGRECHVGARNRATGGHCVPFALCGGPLRAIRVTCGLFVSRAAARVAVACHSRGTWAVACHS